MSENNQTEEKLTLEQVVDKIKGLISRSALAKLDIGLLLTEYKETIDHGDVTAFYEDIGINQRTAQYYKKIASNETVQRLRAEGQLDGLSMAKIIEKAEIRSNPKDIPEYVEVAIEKFEPSTCKKLKAFRVQYELLSNKVKELEAKLAEHEPEEKTA